MKKLNITKERFEKSRYFQKKYGELEYVSESGKIYKTSKGKVLMFNESIGDNEGKSLDEPKKIDYYKILNAATNKDNFRKYPWFDHLEIHEDVEDEYGNLFDYYVLYTKTGQLFAIEVHEI